MEDLGRLLLYVVQFVLHQFGQRPELMLVASGSTAAKQALLVLSETLTAELVLVFFAIGVLCVAGACFALGLVGTLISLHLTWMSTHGTFWALSRAVGVLKVAYRGASNSYTGWRRRSQAVVVRGALPLPEGESTRRRTRRSPSVRFEEPGSAVAVRGTLLRRGSGNSVETD